MERLELQLERLKRWIREMSEAQWLTREAFRSWEIVRTTYVLPGQYENTAPYPEGQGLDHFPSVQGTTYYFRATPDLSGYAEDGRVGLLFESGGEGLLRANGKSYQGLDRNHAYVTLDLERIGMHPELEIELFDPVPEPVDPLNRQAVIQPPIASIRSELVRPNRAVQSLMYAAIVARDSAVLLPETDFRRVRLLEALLAAMDAYVGLEADAIAEGSAVSRIETELKDRVRQTGGNAEGTMRMIGQSHIDIAWLWPMRETVRKTSRTFSTVDALMREYPEFQYAQSQPLLFEFLKRHDPELFERVKERVAEGRWELVGGMWVEPDLNIPSGESLVRQMLYGQAFYRNEFGVTSRIEWLPDTFGYCASLPQILKHGGIEYFMTTKLGWNDTNVFPHDLFHWVGIDGTPILSYLNHGVNEHTLPKDIHEHWQSYRQKAAHPEQMLLYGHGDGGGGVTREMLEFIDRAELMVGQPESRYGTAAAFFAGIAERAPKLPEWRGDLYLELHRGTYTTHARNKRSNRKAESLYREAELWQSLALPRLSAERDLELRGLLHDGWKLILQNQFHDIIPGSAITETYETSEKEYKDVFEKGRAACDTVLAALAGRTDAASPEQPVIRGDGGRSFVVFNSLGWERDIVVELPAATAGIRRGERAGIAAYDADGRMLAADVMAMSGPNGADSGGIDGGVSSSADSEGRDCRVSIRVPAVPAFGCKTIWLRPASSAADSAEREANASVGGLAGAPSEPSGLGVAVVPDEIKEWKEPEGLEGPEGPEGPEELGDAWETGRYKLVFNERGEIASLYDKEAGREIVKPGEAANRFHFYHDRPTLWDAWDIDDRYELQPAGDAVLLEKRVMLRGKVKDVLRFRWKLHRSEIRQDLILYHGDKRIDFRTEVDWNEAHKLLKVGFPIDVVTGKATYEIPFGALERPTHRNTSWEQAQFEVCGHRFADVSEAGYGVSLLNDCKYGYDIQGSTIRLSLLRAPKWPDDTADLGKHEFTYSLYPHEGDWREAHTVRKAAELNAAAACVEGGPVPGSFALPGAASFIRFQANHVVLDTVKPSEDGGGIILRLYESAGGRERVTIGWPQPVRKAFVSNALEDELEELALTDGAIELAFRPFEIKTVKLAAGV